MRLQSYSKVTANLVLILLVFCVGTISNNISLAHAVGGGGAQYKFLSKWGSLGTGNGQFNGTAGIATDASTGNVYVGDSDNNRVEKFDSNGKFITKWGSLGSGNGQFNDGKGIAVDSAGRVYVSDKGNNNIQVFAPA